MEEVVAAARRIERILEEQPDSRMEQVIQSMQDQIRILTKDLAKAHEQMASQATAATPTSAFAAPPNTTVAAAQPPPAASPPASLPVPAPSATPLPPLATAQPPPYPPGGPPYPDFGEEGPYFRPPRRQPDRRPLRCLSLSRSLTATTPAAIASPGNHSRTAKGAVSRASCSGK